MKQVAIIVTPTGEVRMEGHGFVGNECGPIMDQLTQAMGGLITSRELKPEALLEAGGTAVETN